MKTEFNFEVNPYTVTTRSKVLRKPSFDRMAVAVTLTVMLAVICAVIISIYNAEYAEQKNYYPMGIGGDEAVYKDDDRFGGFTVIGDRIEVLEFTDNVERGEWATLRIQGRPNTDYDITVYLKSGPSSNSALISKRSDENGIVEWKWRIYKGTSAGKFKVTVTGAVEENVCLTYAEMYLTITKEK